MSPRRHTLLALASLAAASLLSALLFRLEVESHGWEGLLWLGYFHQAIPLGIALFCMWLALFADIHPRPRRLAFTAAVAAYAALLYWPVYVALRFHFWGAWARPPQYLEFAIFPLLPAIPLGLAALARLFGHRTPWTHLITSLTLFTAAAPLTMLLRPLFDHAGSNDPIHTIKSGCIIPFLMFPLGILFLPRPPQRKPQPGLCPKCAYDLRAHKPGDRCPECGHSIATTANEPHNMKQ